MAENQYSHAELKAGQFPHQLFLFNLVGNHILLLIIAASNSSVPQVALIVPVISALIIAYTLIKGRAQMKSGSDFIRCHWYIVLRRTRIFLIAYALLGSAALVAWLVHTAMPIKEMAYAIVGGLGILPTMVLVLVLTVMESETLHHALKGEIPESLRRKVLGQGA